MPPSIPKPPSWPVVLSIAFFDALACFFTLWLFRDESGEYLRTFPPLDGVDVRALYLRVIVVASGTRLLYSAAVVAGVRCALGRFSDLSDSSTRSWIRISLVHWVVMTIIAVWVASSDPEGAGLGWTGVVFDGIAAVVGAVVGAACADVLAARKAQRQRIQLWYLEA